MTCERSLKLAKANADRKVIANPMVIDVLRLLAVTIANRPNRVETAHVVPMPIESRKVIASLMVIDDRMLLVVKVANRTSHAVMVIVGRMDNVLLKVVDRMASRVSRRVMVIDVPKGKVDEARCRDSSNCSTAITMANSARTNSIGSKKSSTNWIATKTDNWIPPSC